MNIDKRLCVLGGALLPIAIHTLLRIEHSKGEPGPKATSDAGSGSIKVDPMAVDGVMNYHHPEDKGTDLKVRYPEDGSRNPNYDLKPIELKIHNARPFIKRLHLNTSGMFESHYTYAFDVVWLCIACSVFVQTYRIYHLKS